MSFTDIINGSTPTLVDFSAEWCQPCKIQAPELKKLADMLGDSVRILKVDVDKNPKAASQYQVQSVPTLLIFKSGKIVFRQSGVHTAAQLANIIRSL